MRSTCLKEFDAHWQCLERNNQVRTSLHLAQRGEGLSRKAAYLTDTCC